MSQLEAIKEELENANNELIWLRQHVASLENELGKLPEDYSVGEIMNRLYELEGLKNSLSNALQSIASVPLLTEPKGAYDWGHIGKFFDVNIRLARSVCEAFDFEYQVGDFREEEVSESIK